jgi:hypothetical protein
LTARLIDIYIIAENVKNIHVISSFDTYSLRKIAANTSVNIGFIFYTTAIVVKEKNFTTVN